MFYSYRLSISKLAAKERAASFDIHTRVVLIQEGESEMRLNETAKWEASAAVFVAKVSLRRTSKSSGMVDYLTADKP